MTKHFVDSIINKEGPRGEHSPGPDRYKPAKEFGRVGIGYSMHRATRNNGLRTGQFDASFHEAKK